MRGLFFCLWMAGGVANALASELLVSDQGGNLWRVNSSTGQAILLEQTNIPVLGVALNSANELFATSLNQEVVNVLYSIDQETGFGSLVGPIIPAFPEVGFILGLDFSPDAQLYFASVGNKFGTIDTTTGAATVLGSILEPTDVFRTITDIAFAPDGSLWAAVSNEEFEPRQVSLSRFDLATGAENVVGPVGYEVWGLDFLGSRLLGVSYQGELVSINTETGAGSLIAQTSPMVGAVGLAARDLVPPAPGRIDAPDISGLNTGATKLVLITHGYHSDPNFSATWIDDMESAIESAISNDPSWAVVTFHWEELTGPIPTASLLSGQRLGREFGTIIRSLDYEEVHLVGHSAGAELIDEIARALDQKPSGNNDSGPPRIIHTTFLDAYAPPWWRLGNEYGERPENYSEDTIRWSDHYFSNDLPWTQEHLDHAFNVDISLLDDQRLGHEYPHVFYVDTVVGNEPDSQGLGFLISREGGNWNPNAYPHGDTIELSATSPRPNPGPVPVQITWSGENLIKAIADENDFFASSDQAVQIASSGVISMQTASPSWLVTTLAISEDDDLLRFDLEFTSEPGAEGLFAAYIDGVLQATVDERYEMRGKSKQYVLPLEEVAAGLHTLSFRLDPYSDIPSHLQLTNLEFGTIRFLELAGDYSGDGVVDQADLDLVLLNWGRPALPVPVGWESYLPLGVIDQDDLDGVLLNWGMRSEASNIAAVLEPETFYFALILIGMFYGYSFTFMRKSKTRFFRKLLKKGGIARARGIMSRAR